MSSTPHPRTDLPRWARSVDDYTQRSGHARVGRRATRGSGAIGSIVVNAVLLYVAHHLLEWQVGWITPAWSDALWAVDLTLEVSIAVNILFLVFDAAWVRNLGGAASCAVAALATWWLYAIFPFDFGAAGANDLARLTLLAALLATAIAALVMATLAMAYLARAAMGSTNVDED